MPGTVRLKWKADFHPSKAQSILAMKQDQTISQDVRVSKPRGAIGTNHGGTRWAPIERVFSRPIWWALIFMAAIIGLIGLLISGLLGWSPLPGIPRAGLVSDALSGLLALGTLALAYATGYMAQSVRQQAEAAERLRRDQLAPHLSIIVLEAQRVEAEEVPPGPVMVSMFFTRVTGQRSLTFAVRNMGPGNAMSVRVECLRAQVPGIGPWNGSSFQTPPELTNQSPRTVVISNRSLKADESYEFEIPVASPNPPENGVAAGTYWLAGRLCVLAAYKDVEGREMPIDQVQLELQQVSPIKFGLAADRLSSGGDPHGRGYELFWKVTHTGTPPAGSEWIPLPPEASDL